MSLEAWMFLGLAILTLVMDVFIRRENDRLRAENHLLRGRLDGQMRTLSALASESDERIESITHYCPHCKPKGDE